jgi:integrase
MASRRPHGTGSIVERPAGSGNWFFRYSISPDPFTGKPRRRAVTIQAKNKTIAQNLARQIVADAQATAVDSDSCLDDLLSEWMKFQVGRGRSPTTLHGYRSLIAHHIAPSIGTIRISELTAHHLDTLYGNCTRAGRSPRTIRNIHNVIGAALNQGVRWGWLDRNPASKATLPSTPPRKIVVPTPDDARRLIAFCQAQDEVLGAFVFLSAVTGCRRGEVAALRWNSIENGLLIIRESAYSVKGDEGVKSTKSGRERVVHLDPAVKNWLDYWFERSKKQALDWGVQLTLDGFILSSRPDGSRFVSLDAMSRGVRRAADHLGMNDLHLHSLRHFAATELLAAGITANDAAEMLGHADPSLTLRVYAHAKADRQEAAAGVLARLIDGPQITAEELASSN